MSQRTLLFTSTRGAYRPLVYQGTLIHQAHQQLMRLVSERLSPEHVALFAEPVADAGQDAIDWYSRVAGETRRLDQVTDERRLAVEGKLARIVGDLERCIKELESSPDQDKRAAGKMLELALQHPDASTLFLVGDQPVLAGWGTAPASSDLDPESLIRRRPQALLESSEDVVRAKAVPPPIPPSPPAPPLQLPASPPLPPPPPQPPQAGKGCAWWLLRALLLALALGLLLLALAWLLPPGCSPLAGLPGFGLPGGGLPGGGGGPGGPGSGADGGDAGKLAPRLEQHQGREAELRAELERLRAELEQRRQACLVRKPPAPEPAPEPIPAPQPEKPAAPERPAVTPTKPAPPPRATPSTTTTTIPKCEPLRAAPKPEQPLTVTKEDQDNKDVGFLKGQWQSVTNLVEEGTDRPVMIELEIDEKGNGTSTIVRENGQRCPAPMRSYFDDQGNLVFEDVHLHPCPDGSKFQPSQVVCQVGSDGRAKCRGRHPNGHTYDVIIKRR